MNGIAAEDHVIVEAKDVKVGMRSAFHATTIKSPALVTRSEQEERLWVIGFSDGTMITAPPTTRLHFWQPR